jgi:hypothetical protein
MLAAESTGDSTTSLREAFMMTERWSVPAPAPPTPPDALAGAPNVIVAIAVIVGVTNMAVGVEANAGRRVPVGVAVADGSTVASAAAVGVVAPHPAANNTQRNNEHVVNSRANMIDPLW